MKFINQYIPLTSKLADLQHYLLRDPEGLKVKATVHELASRNI